MDSHEFATVQAGKLASYPKGSRGLRILPDESVGAALGRERYPREGVAVPTARPFGEAGAC